MSFADSWYRASCALLLFTLHFSMFPFYPPLSFSLSLALSLSLLPLSLCGCKTHVIWCPLPNILFLINLTFFHAKSCHRSFKIHQLFTDYLLRLPSSEPRTIPTMSPSTGSKTIAWRQRFKTHFAPKSIIIHFCAGSAFTEQSPSFPEECTSSSKQIGMNDHAIPDSPAHSPNKAMKLPCASFHCIPNSEAEV